VLQFLMAALDERLAETGLTPEDVFRRSEARERSGAGAKAEPDKAARARLKKAASAEAIRKEESGGVVEEDVFFKPEAPRAEPVSREKEPAPRERFQPRMPSPIVDAAMKRGYLDATRGYFEVPVSIGDLRGRVRLEPREFDHALARMLREGKLEIDGSSGEGNAAAVIFRE
jgi:hypothetical protein